MMEIDGKITTHQQTIAEKFNNYYVCVAGNITTTTTTTNNNNVNNTIGDVNKINLLNNLYSAFKQFFLQILK